MDRYLVVVLIVFSMFMYGFTKFKCFILSATNMIVIQFFQFYVELFVSVEYLKT